MKKTSLPSLGFPRATQIKFGALLVALALPTGAMAANFTWGVTSGTWSTGSSWTGGTAPTSDTPNDVIELVNGTSGTPAETTFTTASWVLGTNTSVTINANNILTLSGGSVLHSQRTGSSVTNHGIIQSSSTSGKLRGATGTRSNDGTIQALSGGTLTLWDFGTLTNTGGTIQAKSGGTVKFEGNATISGGTLKSESGGFLLQDGTASSLISLNGVTVTNQGMLTNDQTLSSPTTVSTSLRMTLGTGTVLTNEVGATTQVRNTGGGTTTSTSVRRSLFTVDAGATFANAGTLLIQNDATRFGSLTGQDATFAVASGATFSNVGTIQVIANTTAVGATAVFTSTQSITNQGVVHIKGNANGQFASFSVNGTGNDYTQSGVGVRTILEQGGSLSAADSVLINAGTLGGVGSVTGATTIGSDATLAAGETYAGAAGAGVLAFNNNLTLSNDSEIKFALGLNTAASSQVTLAGASGLTLGTNITVTLTDLTEGNWVEGTTYRLFDLASGTIIGDIANFSLVAPIGWTGTFSTGVGGTDYVDFTLAAVPEPSAMVLLAGSLTVMMVFARRRRCSQ